MRIPWSVAIHDGQVFAARAGWRPHCCWYKSTASGWSLVRSGLRPGGCLSLSSASSSGDARESVLRVRWQNVPFRWSGGGLRRRWRPSRNRSPPARPMLLPQAPGQRHSPRRGRPQLCGGRHGDDPQQRGCRDLHDWRCHGLRTPPGGECDVLGRLWHGVRLALARPTSRTSRIWMTAHKTTCSRRT